MSTFPGEVSELMRISLRVFFAAGANAMQRGPALTSSDGRSALVPAIFGGFLADEKGQEDLRQQRPSWAQELVIAFFVFISSACLGGLV